MLLSDLLIVFLFAGAVVFLLYRVKVPTVVGFLVTGVLIGPHGLSLVSDAERISLLAEIGVVVLLFTVGLEFSLSRLLAMRRMTWQIGVPQILLCIGVSVLATWWYLGTLSQSLFVGMLVAMSSTAIVLKILAERADLSTLHGRINLSVLILQDLLVPVCVLLIPLLAPRGAGEPTDWSALPIGLAVVGAILVAGKYLVPPLLDQIVRTRNREIFIIAIFVLCIGTATLTAQVGMSLALGAFLAGMILADSEYGHQTMAEVLPFRDTLSSLFFVSVGMLLDLNFIKEHALLIAVSVVALQILKFLSVALPTALSGYPLRNAVFAGVATAQVGEFSFVMATKGQEVGLLNTHDYQIFLAASVITMGLTPFLINSGPRVVEAVRAWPLFTKWVGYLDAAAGETPAEQLKDHVVFAGYGPHGRHLANVLRQANIPYVFLDTNPVVVKQKKAEGESIQFGDCTRPAVLRHAGLQYARVLVVGISDLMAVRRTVHAARHLAPNAQIILRTRFRAEEVEGLRMHGVNQIILDEFEGSMEALNRILKVYTVEGDGPLKLIEEARHEHSQTLQSS